MADKKTTIVPNPTAPEVFADRASSVTMRGNVARMTFASERVAADPTPGDLVVSGHLAMSMRGFLQLYGQMQSIVRQMEESGMIRRAAEGDTAPETPKKPAAGRAKSPRKRAPAKKK